MSHLLQPLAALRALLDTESNPDRLRVALADGVAALQQEIPCCQALTDEERSLYLEARDVLRALQDYRRLVSLIDGVPDDSEINEIVDRFLQLAKRLRNLPVRREVVLEFASLRRAVRKTMRVAAA